MYIPAGKGKSPDADSGAIINSTEDEQLQELGKPRLGDLVKIQISIKESQEFKVTSIHIYTPIILLKNLVLVLSSVSYSFIQFKLV
jgi:hypothetical protein